MTLTNFKFIIEDAFHASDRGLYGILETGIESKRINFLIDEEVFFLNIIDEKEFINDLLNIGILNWNHKNYIQYHEDGYTWRLMLSYDDITIYTIGDNAYPKEFDSFMEMLHTKYNLPYLSMEIIDKKKKKIKLKWHAKGNIIEKI